MKIRLINRINGENHYIKFPCADDVLTEELNEIGVSEVAAPICIAGDFGEDLQCLNILQDTDVNVDELNYLAKRIDSFDVEEVNQFKGIIWATKPTELKDMINLTFNLHNYTLITDMSDLEEVGETHRNNCPRCHATQCRRYCQRCWRGNRKFICVQLPEVTDEKSEAYKAGYQNICEIGKERIRRAGAKILTEIEETHSQVKLGEEEKALPDVGFKVFKLDTSNLKTWDGTPIDETDSKTLFDRLRDSIDSIKSDRSALDTVYEIMLKMGVPLTYAVLPIEIDEITAYSVGEDCLLLICLSDGITSETIEKMAEYTPAKVILAESALVDTTAMRNAFYILRDKGVELKLI